jgi:hypothetical protein
MESPRTPPPTDGDPRVEDPFAASGFASEAWDREGAPPPPRGNPGLDPAALFVLLDGLRRVVPRELEGQLSSLIREFLLTLRALINWYLERLDRPAPEPRVEDIPID